MVVVLLIALISIAYAGDYYLIIVAKSSGNVIDRLSGYPGRAFGKTADRIYLFGGENEIAWLESKNIEFSKKLFYDEPSSLYLNYFDNQIFPAAVEDILDKGTDYLLAIAPLPGAISVRRLQLRKLPFGSRDARPANIVTYHPTIDSLVGADRKSVV